ncbi:MULTISPECIES: hypothetical protein [unclassified Solwaraspora]|uniref:hypothetical protein n=1 Tax=unclassified Solwaraspora TaxID=2627926 RepID=UPI00259B9156|nr:hypothetical protein [Solwaraspora sp. WMMA2056]WJK43036.1 hypothetical protein O7608_11965 [Solwaraspora sp. WMMA2056]
MIYLVYRMKLSARARQHMAEFWSWLEQRERFFYDDLPMVESVRWYYSVIGDVYVIENWAAFRNEAAWGEYRAALATLKSDTSWEHERVSQDEWWEFLDTRIVTDPPVTVGFTRQP